MRTATEVIDQAIQENRVPEYLLYGFAVVFVLTGEFLIGWSIYFHYPWGALGGVGLNGLAWPAYMETRRIRKENVMLRTLEIALSKAHTAKEAASILVGTFSEQFKVEKAAKAARAS